MAKMENTEHDLDYLIGDGPTVYSNEDLFRELQSLNAEMTTANSYLASISGSLSVIVYSIFGGVAAYVVGKFFQ